VRLHRGLALAAVAIGGASAAAAQTPERMRAVDRYVREELQRQRIPGLSVAVLRGGKVLLARGYGYANVEHQVPATDSTVYQSGSLGKMFTAALVLQLADSGRLGLDDPIRRHLPEGPPRWDSITVRHLLTHTSGIPDYTDSVVDLHRDYTEDELVRVAAALPPLFAPGERWSYSNTGYVLLGAIIRRVGGRFYGDLLRDRIFAPLGMRAARVISEADIVPHRSEGYRLAGDTLKHQEWVSPSLNTTADGSLYFTVHDLVRWLMGLDAHRVLSAPDLAAAWTPVRLNDGGTYPYGFGWMLGDMRGRPRLGHTGSWQGFKTSLERFPQADLTVIVLANLEQARPDAIALGVAGILEPSLVPPHRLAARLPGPMPPEPLDTVLHRLSSDTVEDSVTDALTPGLRRFLSAADRREWGDLASRISGWTPLGCDRVPGQPITRLGASVTRLCYARGADREGNVAVTVLYTDEWRVADVDTYRF
jgi:CubicO group peptidase (beta-lactamase class C family)